MRAMRKTLTTLVLCMGLFTAAEAHATASFANRSLGLGVSGFRLLGEESGVDWGIPLTLEGGYYIENGFDLYLRVPLMLLYQKFGFGPDQSAGGLILATGGQFGVRYLFMEESLRPYVNLHLAGIYFFRDGAAFNLPNFFAGPGVGAGVDYFVGESISIGARAYFDLFITLNAAPRFAIGGGINAATYF